MRNVSVRSANRDDIPAVELAIRDAELTTSGLRDQFGESYAVAESDGQIVGVVGIEVHGDNGLLRSAVVMPPWRGKGIGEALVRDRIEWSRRHGLRALYLLTKTAVDYFPRFGFQSIERAAAPNGIRGSVKFAEDCCATAAVMMLPLSDAALASLTEEVRIMLGSEDTNPGNIPQSRA
jgi:amino-acid N-acetyltransferase